MGQVIVDTRIMRSSREPKRRCYCLLLNRQTATASHDWYNWRMRKPETSNFARYQRIAPFYDLLDLPFEYGRYRRIRPLLFEGLDGRLLDAGVGTGRNFPFYPSSASVVGIDLSPAVLARATVRAHLSPALIVLKQMDVTRLDFSDAAFDAAVATFLFCVLPDEL